MTHEWTDDMGEISGFGGGYETACRAMVLAGIRWLDEHFDADPKFKGLVGVYGLMLEDNDDAKALTAAIMDTTVTDPNINNGEPFRVADQATGAMHHAAIQHCLAYRRLGWDKYRRQLRERKEKPDDKPKEGN